MAPSAPDASAADDPDWPGEIWPGGWSAAVDSSTMPGSLLLVQAPGGRSAVESALASGSFVPVRQVSGEVPERSNGLLPGNATGTSFSPLTRPENRSGRIVRSMRLAHVAPPGCGGGRYNLSFKERCQSGRMGSPGKRVYGNPVPRVRTERQRGRCAADEVGEATRSEAEGKRRQARSQSLPLAARKGRPPQGGELTGQFEFLRRGARAVEWARLESECTVIPYRGFESLPLRHHQEAPPRAARRAARWLVACALESVFIGEVAERLNAPVLKTGKG